MYFSNTKYTVGGNRNPPLNASDPQLSPQHSFIKILHPPLLFPKVTRVLISTDKHAIIPLNPYTPGSSRILHPTTFTKQAFPQCILHPSPVKVRGG